MPRGFWDYGVNPSGIITAPRIGPAELAVRLGSIVSYDRMGEVFWLDSFESGFQRWTAAYVGTPGEVVLKADGPRSGAYSMGLRASLVADREAGIDLYTSTPTQSRLGLEASFQLWSDTSILEMRIAAANPTLSPIFALRYNIQSSTVQRLNNASAWVTLATGIQLFSIDRSYSTIKLVVDPANRNYVRATIAGQVYDLAGLPGPGGGGVSFPSVYVRIAHIADGSNNNWVYVDDVIITHNEP